MDETNNELIPHFPTNQPSHPLPKSTGWLKNIFTNSNSNKRQLENRIHELQRTASRTLADLTTVKQELKDNIDSTVSPYIERLVAPLVRDVQHINKRASKSHNELEKAETLQLYQQWIEQAQEWVQFLSNEHKDRHALEQGIIRHSLRVNKDDVTNDLKVIRDYCKHRFGELDPNLTKEERKQLRRRVNNKIADNLNSLRKMRRTHIRPNSLEELRALTTKLSAQREKIFNHALSQIDKVTQPENLAMLNAEREHLVVNFLEMADLESALPQLIADIQKHRSDTEGFTLQERFFVLENEAFELEQELDLTPELADRFAHVQHLLMQARQFLFPNA